MVSIAENLRQVQEKIAAAAERSGREAGDITLVGATKMNDAGRIQEAIAAGLRFCGGKPGAGASGKAASGCL